jgi:hypothetical protein
MQDFAVLFDKLPPPAAGSGPERFAAIPIPGCDRHRIGKDVAGLPCLLITAVDSAAVRPAPIRLENISVDYDLDCRVSQSSHGAEEARLTVVRCRAAETALHALFLRVAGPLTLTLGSEPSRVEVARAIASLVDLFQALRQPSQKSLQGLWAELFLIARASDPLLLINGWHIGPDDRYDFNAGGERIEVKSASGRIRQHYFSLEQLGPPAGTRLLVASIFTERAGAGTSLEDLLSTVRQRISASLPLMERLNRIAYMALGSNWQAALDERFDLELAQESLAFFSSEGISTPSRELPAGVTDVRFRSDLSGQQPVDSSSMLASTGLFRAALPR